MGVRTLDVDLIDVEGITSADPALSLPHPRAAERAFVLVPWSQADPFAELAGHSVSDLAENAPDRGGVAARASAARLTKPSAPAVLPAEAAVGALVEGALVDGVSSSPAAAEASVAAL